MVKRISRMKEKGIVIDLDGTFLLINTFERYFFYVWKDAVLKFKLHRVLFMFFLLVGRKLRFYNHSYFKMKVLSVNYLKERGLQLFVNSIIKNLNPRVYNLYIDYRNRGYYTCLATAAPLLYADLIGKRFGFDAVCATPSCIGNNKEHWIENARENKLLYVKDFLDKKEVTIDVVVTDHYDDLPLMKRSRESNFLVAPSPKTVSQLLSNKIKFEIV